MHQCYTAGYLDEETGAWVQATYKWKKTGENTALASYLGDGDGYDLGFVDPGKKQRSHNTFDHTGRPVQTIGQN